MKTLLLVLCFTLFSGSVIADPYRSYNALISDIEYIDAIRDHLPGTYKYIMTEWQQTSINSIVATRADKTSRENRTLIDSINDELDDVYAGIAGAMAMASLPFASNGSDSFMIGAGVYNGQSAVAVGISGNTDDGKVLKFSFSSDTAGNKGGSVGASFEF